MTLEVRKAAILAGGLGTRLRAHEPGVTLDPENEAAARSGEKWRISIHGRPMIDYNVQTIIDAGFSELGIVLSPTGDRLRRYLETSGASLGFHFAVQSEPRGAADAVACLEEYAGGEPFIVMNCDNLYTVDVLSELRTKESDDCWAVGYDRDALIANSNIEPAKIASYAVMDIDENWSLRRIVEKSPNPDIFAIDGKVLVSMNVFRFTPAVFDAIRHIEPHPLRGELEIQTAIQWLVDHGHGYRVMPSSQGVYDLTRRADIPALQAMLPADYVKFARGEF